MSDKQIKVFKIIVIILVVILVGELIYFGIRSHINRENSTFYTVENSMISDNKKDIAVGFSDYRYSKFNDYKDGYNKATVFVYEKDKLLKEVSLKIGFNSYYYDIIKVKDGYVAVGSIEMDKEQNKDKISEGMIVKYDKNFKQVWRKNVSVIGKTEFYKVREDDGNLVVVGTSVYGDGYVGNHTTGGGILVVFDSKGNKKKIINNGGPYVGKFNDFVIEKDGYVVVGLGRKNSGVIIKYNKNGKKVWSSYYGYTDENGITAISKMGKNYVLSTTKLVDKDEKNNYDASVIVFNSKGDKVDETKYSSSNITYFTDILTDKKNNVYVCGSAGMMSSTGLKSDAILVKFDKDLYEKGSKIIKGDNNDHFVKLYLENDKIKVLGFSNSKIKKYNANGYDYSPFTEVYSTNLK